MTTQRPLFPHHPDCACPDCVEARCRHIAAATNTPLEHVRAAVAVARADKYSAWPNSRKDTADE